MFLILKKQLILATSTTDLMCILKKHMKPTVTLLLQYILEAHTQKTEEGPIIDNISLFFPQVKVAHDAVVRCCQ